VFVQYDEQLNDISEIVSSIDNICGTSQSSASYLVCYSILSLEWTLMIGDGVMMSLVNVSGCFLYLCSPAVLSCIVNSVDNVD